MITASMRHLDAEPILIIGASGLVGGELYSVLKGRAHCIGTYLRNHKAGLVHLDATDKLQIDHIFRRVNPRIVLLPAAQANVDYCELNHEASQRQNVAAVENVVSWCSATQAKLVFLSTDYVFDGASGPYSETDQPAPINIYGCQKLIAEQVVLGSASDSLVIRTSLVYGPSSASRGFISTVLGSLRRNEMVSASAKHVNSPTLVSDLVDGILRLIAANRRGIYHVSGPSPMSRFDLALILAKVFRYDTSLVLPESAYDRDRKAVRPERCGLRIDKAESEVHFRPMPPDEGLIRALQATRGD